MNRRPRSHQGCTPIRAALLFATAAILAAPVTGCRSLPPSKPEADLTPQERAGQQVFVSYCARCHNPTSTRGKKGPGLQAITKVKAMPSGAPGTDQNLLRTIEHGHGMMQPVPVPSDQLQDLLAYLHTL